MMQTVIVKVRLRSCYWRITVLGLLDYGEMSAWVMTTKGAQYQTSRNNQPRGESKVLHELQSALPILTPQASRAMLHHIPGVACCLKIICVGIKDRGNWLQNWRSRLLTSELTAKIILLAQCMDLDKALFNILFLHLAARPTPHSLSYFLL